MIWIRIKMGKEIRKITISMWFAGYIKNKKRKNNVPWGDKINYVTSSE